MTIGINRANPVWVDGTSSLVSPTNSINLTGGQVSQLSAGTYRVSWNTGEVLTVTNYGSYLDLKLDLNSSTDGPGSVMGLIGPNEGQANDFMLPDGTVLQQPLTENELYQTFANAWRVLQQLSLFDYGPGQSTATFTDTNFPYANITLSDLPSNVVARAAQVVAAFGITDPTVAATAEFDYLAFGGDLGVVASDASGLQGIPTNPATIIPSGPRLAVLGVIPDAPAVAEAQTGSTPVTFDVYLTAPENSDTEVDYQVVAPNSGDLGASAFGGTLPSGAITLGAGSTSGQFSIEIPDGALGSLSSANLAVQISSPGNVPVFAGIGQAMLLAPQPGGPPVPKIVDLTHFGNFTQDPSHPNQYTLDLGSLQLGEPIPPIQFAIQNAATAPSDQLTGTFAIPSIAGFTVSGATVPSPIFAGQSYNGLTVNVDQNKFGANEQKITFNPIDTNPSGFSAPLAPITLTIAYTLELPGMIYSQAFGDVHILTYNGLNYDFQATGDYVLAQSRIPDDNFQIQLELEPWFAGASVSTIHQVAIALGSDRVTFDWSRASPVLVDGAAPSGLTVSSPLTLAGGTITEISSTMYKVDWATGETMTVTYYQPWASFLPAFINVTDGIVGNAGPDAYAGLQGEDAGQQNDFQLADGTVLPQPLIGGRTLRHLCAFLGGEPSDLAVRRTDRASERANRSGDAQ